MTHDDEGRGPASGTVAVDRVGGARRPDPWLSAIVPNYNDAALLPRAVAALCRQEPPPGEIIVIDDGSTDHSPEVITRLAAEVPTLVALRNDRNLGVIPTLNRGLAAARGRYVYMGSANDTVAPGFLAAARPMLETCPNVGFFSGETRLVDTDGRPIGLRPPARPAPGPAHVPAERMPALLRRIDNFAPSSAVVWRRAAAAAAGGLRPEMGSFADGYLVRSLAVRHGFCFAPVIGANRTADPAGVSRVTAGRPEIALGVMAAALAGMRADPHFPPGYPALFERRWRFGVGRLAAGAPRDVLSSLDPVVAPTPADASVWHALARVPGGPGRILRLAWLTARFRPYRLRPIVATWLARLWERR